MEDRAEDVGSVVAQGSQQQSSQQQLNLRAFSLALELSPDRDIPASLYANSTMAESNGSSEYAMDDSALQRRYGFEVSQSTSMTAPKPSNLGKKVYICPSNSFVASNGEVYQIEPFMLPPPSEIAELMSMVRDQRRERGDSNLGLNDAREHGGGSSGGGGGEGGDGGRRSGGGGGGGGGGVGGEREQKYIGAELGESQSPHVVSRKLASMTPFSPATLNGSVEWMAPGKPRGLLQSTTPIPARIATSSLASPTSRAYAGAGSQNSAEADESSDPGCDTPPPKRGGVSRTTFPHGEYRSRTSSAPPFSQMIDSAARDAEQHVFGSDTPKASPISSRGGGSLGISHDSNDAIALATALNPPQQLAPHLESARSKFHDVFSKQQTPPSEGEYFHLRKFSLIQYLKVEMFGVGESEKSERKSPDTIANFLAVPLKIERMVWFGFFVCFDAFWYTVTYLPIRMLYSLYVLAKELLSGPLSSFGGLRLPPKVVGSNRFFHRTHAYDLMVGALMLLAVSSLQMLNMGRVYHYIRGQNMIKLYVLTGMLEIFDKLLSSFGQDAFDSLYGQTRRYQAEDMGNVSFSFFIVAIYVMIHSAIYFIHIATLTVAINSAEQALITVLILNNFAEIKGFVFKKFDKQNLFQLACSDITERFQLCLFLTTITAVAFAQSGSIEAGIGEVLPSHCYIVAIMVAGESVADWIKHAFISKFNFIDASVYDDFMRVLRKDILNSHKDKVILNHTYAITRRVGLSQIPLGAVAVRYVILALSSVGVRTAFNESTRLKRFAVGAGIFAAMVLFKIFIGVALVLVSGLEHNKELDAKAAKLQQAVDSGKQPLMIKRESLAQLSNIERYTVYRGKVLG